MMAKYAVKIKMMQACINMCFSKERERDERVNDLFISRCIQTSCIYTCLYTFC